MSKHYFLIVLFFSSYASADLIEFEFSGQFNQEFILNGEFFDSSDSFLGTISYDRVMANNEQNSPYPNGSYSLYSFTNSTKFTLAFGENTFESFFFDCSVNSLPDPMTGIVPECIEPLYISVSDNGLAEGDKLLFNSPNMTLNNELLANEIKINFSLNFSSYIDLSILTNSNLPLLPPDPDVFNGVRSFSIFTNDGDVMNQPQISFSGSVDTVTPTKVSEPSSSLMYISVCFFIIRKYKSTMSSKRIGKS